MKQEYYYKIFEYFQDNHNLTLTNDEINDIPKTKITENYKEDMIEFSKIFKYFDENHNLILLTSEIIDIINLFKNQQR